LFEDLLKELARFFSNHAYAILGATAFLVAAVLFAYFAGRLLRYILLTRLELDRALVRATVSILRWSIVALSVVVVLDEYGLNVTSLIAILSVFGLAMAFGMRPLLVNFFTGVMLNAMKPFDVGDFVEGASVKGVVESSNLFHTVIVTTDGTYVSVPNGPMWAKAIKNRSKMRPRQLVFDITVGKSSNYDDVCQAIADVFSADETRHGDFETTVSLETVADDTMSLSAAAWFKPAAFLVARETLPLALHEKLAAVATGTVTVAPRDKDSIKKPEKAAVEELSDEFI
jgi:small conductance mechanosensitive channel